MLFFLFRRSVPLGRHPRLLSVAEVKPCRPPTSPAHNRDHLRLLGLVGCHGCRGLLALVVRKSLFRAILTNPKPEHLPRQARDKHLESTQKKTRVFHRARPHGNWMDNTCQWGHTWDAIYIITRRTAWGAAVAYLVREHARFVLSVSSFHSFFHRMQHG